MHSLSGIIAMNRRAAEQAALQAETETETSRHCSFTQDGVNIILHSAKHRNTVFLGPKQAAKFAQRARKWQSNEQLDRLIESYF